MHVLFESNRRSVRGKAKLIAEEMTIAMSNIDRSPELICIMHVHCAGHLKCGFV